MLLIVIFGLTCVSILQETIVDSFLDLFIGLATGSHLDVKEYTDVHGCLDGLLDPDIFVVALGVLSCLHSREVLLKARDSTVNPIHNLNELSLGSYLSFTDRFRFTWVLLKEITSEPPEFIDFALLGLNPVFVELADFGSIHSLTELHIALLDLSNLFAGSVRLESKHVIDSSITDFLELIHSPFRILEGCLGGIQPLSPQVDSVCLGKGERVEASVKRSQC